jgi:hypothetical protein
MRQENLPHPVKPGAADSCFGKPHVGEESILEAGEDCELDVPATRTYRINDHVSM